MAQALAHQQITAERRSAWVSDGVQNKRRDADIALFVGDHQEARTGHGWDAVTEMLPAFMGRLDASGRQPRWR
jgi:hypothetical protein